MQVLGLQAYDENDEVIPSAKIISIDGVIEVWVGEKKISADVVYSYPSVNTDPESNSRGKFGMTSTRLRSRKKRP